VVFPIISSMSGPDELIIFSTPSSVTVLFLSFSKKAICSRGYCPTATVATIPGSTKEMVLSLKGIRQVGVVSKAEKGGEETFETID